MGNDFFTKETLRYFFNEFETKNPFLILIFLSISINIYALSWMFNLNKKFEEIDENAPIPSRAFATLFLIPLGFFIIAHIIKKIILQPQDLIYFKIVEVLSWSIIGFLSLKYTYDFCLSFSKITNTSATLWYLLLYPGFLSLILYYFTQEMLILILAVIPTFTIPIMQSTINNKYNKITLDSQSQKFNYQNTRAQ